MKELKGKAEDTTDSEKVTALGNTIKELETQIVAGKGDEALTAKLKADIEGHEKTIGEYKTQLEEEKTKYQSKMEENENILRSGEYKKASADLTFKDGTSDTSKMLLLRNAEEELKADGYELKFIDADGKMNAVLSKNGVPISEKLSDLLAGKLKDELGEPRKQEGTGVNGGKTKPVITGEVLELSPGLKSQASAMTDIHKKLLALGHAVDSPEYKNIKDKTWTEVVVPMALSLRE